MKIDPERRDPYADATGIYVRVADGVGFFNADIAQLDGPSLLEWLRSRGGNNPWAENTVAHMLGHKMPIATEPSQ